jgi:hypothetical protein
MDGTSEPVETAAQCALRLPKIRAAILPFVGDDGYTAALGRAVRVNGAWAAATLPLLWQQAPHMALAAVPAPRCHLYDGAIRSVALEAWRSEGVAKSWQLPRLRSLSYTYRDSFKRAAPRIAAFLPRCAATLTALSIQYDSRPDEDTKRKLSQPWLPDAGFRRDRDNQFRRMGSTFAVLALIARLPALRQVSLEPTITQEAVQGLTQLRMENPFPSLSHFDSVIRINAAEGLC